MQYLKVAFVQSDIVWHNAEQNRIRFREKIISLKGKVDLVVLPEMFTTGFSMSPKLVSEKMDGTTTIWMQKMAFEFELAIAGSVIIKENGNYYNRFLFVLPTGEIDGYDKRHLFSLAGEDKVYTPGYYKKIIDYKGWRICPQICYDLRFPVFARNVEDFDLLLYVANWPKPRINAWDTLLKARAIENMCYVVGVNRIGKDANSLEYIGHSAIYDCLGVLCGDEIVENECIEIVELDKQDIEEKRKKFNFLADRDDFKLLH